MRRAKDWGFIPQMLPISEDSSMLPVRIIGTAEPTTGSIASQVVGSLDNSIVGATVSDGTRSVLTDESGNFVIANVPPGTYTLTITATGFTTRVIGDVVVSAGEPTPVTKIVMEVATGSIWGLVLDWDAQPIGDAVITLSGSSLTGISNLAYPTLGLITGRFLIANVPVGTYTVTVTQNTYGSPKHATGVVVVEGQSVQADCDPPGASKVFIIE